MKKIPKNQNKSRVETVSIEELQFNNLFSVHNPEQQNVVIKLADLKLRLIQYKKNVLNTQVAVPFIALIAYWVPYVTSDFKSIFRFSPDEVRGMYFMLGIILTLVFVKSISSLIGSKIMIFFPKLRIRNGLTIRDSKMTESDPEKFAELLCDDSQ